MFFAVLFNAFSSLLEIMSLFEARPIVEKHKNMPFIVLQLMPWPVLLVNYLSN